jgi:hypothetical protein
MNGCAASAASTAAATASREAGSGHQQVMRNRCNCRRSSSVKRWSATTRPISSRAPGTVTVAPLSTAARCVRR